MYRGKFDQKHRPKAAGSAMLLAQRTGRNTPRRDSTGMVQKQNSRIGTLVFYLYLSVWGLAFFTATFFGMLRLRNWLVDFELAQPMAKSQQVFEALFENPDWAALYEAAGGEQMLHESADTFISYMEQRVGDGELRFTETSAGLSGDHKYVVRLGNEQIATFSLTNQQRGNTTSQLPDWQLGQITFFLQQGEPYYIELFQGHTAYVNGIALAEDDTIRVRGTKAQDYLPVGTTEKKYLTQKISGLLTAPTVQILDENGQVQNAFYDEETRMFRESVMDEPPDEEIRKTALNAIHAYALYMNKQTGMDEIGAWFVKDSSAYEMIRGADRTAVASARKYEFTDEQVSNFTRYGETLCSIRVSLTLNMTRSDGSVKEDTIAQSLFFSCQSGESWKCYAMTAVDVSEPVEEVRLTFLVEGTEIHTGFYAADASSLTFPTVDVPVGKTFSGWMREEGDRSMHLLFVPNASGQISIPENTTLEPMILYALLEET